MFDGKALGGELVQAMREFVARSLDPVIARLAAIETREIPDIEAMRQMLERFSDEIAVLRDLPTAPSSFLIDDAGELVALYPDGEKKTVGTVRGKDGGRGAAVMDCRIDTDGQLILRMSDGRILNAGKARGEPGERGLVGDRGKDAAEIHILSGIDEERSYSAGIIAAYRGGLIRAERQTDPVEAGDIARAGWGVVLEGIAEESEHGIDGGRFLERTTVYTSGRVWMRRVQTEAQIWRDIWKAGNEYLRGDTVTRDGSTWHCQVSGTEAVPGISSDWKLCAKRGNHGKDSENGSRRNHIGAIGNA